MFPSMRGEGKGSAPQAGTVAASRAQPTAEPNVVAMHDHELARGLSESRQASKAEMARSRSAANADVARSHRAASDRHDERSQALSNEIERRQKGGQRLAA